jgi:hypothetical protein
VRNDQSQIGKRIADRQLLRGILNSGNKRAAVRIRRGRASVVDRLTDAPRPGVQPRLTAEQVCQIVALACEQPSGSGRPISQWSHRELPGV